MKMAAFAKRISSRGSFSLDTSSQQRSRLEDVNAHNVFLSTTLVCGQTGAVEDMSGIQQVLEDTDTRYTLHVDATQAVGKIPVSFPETGATSLAFTPHKFGGPRGNWLSHHQEKC